MMEIEFAHDQWGKVFDVGKRIDDEGNVFRTVLPCERIAERLAQGAAEAEIGNRVGVRKMNAYIAIAGPVFAQAGVSILRCQCTVGEDDDRKLPRRRWIIDFDWDGFIARGVVQFNVLDREYLIRP